MNGPWMTIDPRPPIAQLVDKVEITIELYPPVMNDR